MTTRDALDPITLSVVSGTFDTTIRDMTTVFPIWLKQVMR